MSGKIDNYEQIIKNSNDLLTEVRKKKQIIYKKKKKIYELFTET